MATVSSFRDNLWLHAFGLSKDNILEYFYASPFFDLSSNNQVVRTQGVGNDFLLGMVGVQYSADCVETDLFVIRKYWRHNKDTITSLGVFYCWHGSIFESPNLFEVMKSSTLKTANHVQLSFSTLQKCCDGDCEGKLSERSTTSAHVGRLPAFKGTTQNLSSSF